MNDDELLQQYKAEIEKLETSGFQIYITLRPTLAVTIIGALQLALRHPDFKSKTSEIIFRFVRWLHDEFKPHAPYTAEVIRRGGLAQYDQPARTRHPKKGGNHAQT